MRVAIWVPGTPVHFLIHVHGAFHVLKQMGLDTKFQEAANAVENLKFDWDIKKDAHSNTKKDKKKKAEEEKEEEEEVGRACEE